MNEIQTVISQLRYEAREANLAEYMEFSTLLTKAANYLESSEKSDSFSKIAGVLYALGFGVGWASLESPHEEGLEEEHLRWAFEQERAKNPDMPSEQAIRITVQGYEKGREMFRCFNEVC